MYCFLQETDELLDKYGIKYIHIESGPICIQTKLEEIGNENVTNECNDCTHWCELSWGIGDNNELFDVAVNSFGSSLGDAIQKCLNFFLELARKDPNSKYAEIAKHFNIPLELVINV